MRLHILSDPTCPTGLDHRENYFAYDCYKFINHLSYHFDMIHYGVEGSKVDCQHFDLPSGDTNLWSLQANKLIGENKMPGDLILCFQGAATHLATTGHDDCRVIEPHIGYRTSSVFAPYRVFTSYAQMHFYYGQQGMLMNPSWWDEVIYNAIDPSEFTFLTFKEDYAVIMGRVQEDKGINIAIQATEKAGIKLVIAGSPRSLKHLNYAKTPKHVELVGAVNVEQRRKLLANAKVLIAPTTYVEPFGCMVPEAHLSGTPTITTNWGAFPETNEHGKTGFICRSMPEFVKAIQDIDSISNSYCYNRAMEMFTDEVIYPRYVEYLHRVILSNFYFAVTDSATAPYIMREKEDKALARAIIESNSIQPKDIDEDYKKWAKDYAGETNPPEGIKMTINFDDEIEVSGVFHPDPQPCFSVIIPTMGKSNDELFEMLRRYEDCPLVGEVLVVDNNNMDFIDIASFLNKANTHKKVLIIYSGPNIYVNPAWNLGVEKAQFPYLLFANDDILIEDLDNLLAYIRDSIETNEVIGIDIKRMNQYFAYFLQDPKPIEYQGWGCFFAMKKEFYVPIPEEIKIWCGDNIQWVCNSPKILCGVKGVAKQSVTIDSDRSHFEPIMKRDWELFAEWHKERFEKKDEAPKRILHVIMSCGRPEYLERSLQSVKDNLDFGHHLVERWLIDDYPEGRDKALFRSFRHKYSIDSIATHTKNRGLSTVWNEIWDEIWNELSRINDSGYDYILHQEDDVVLLEKVHINDWIKVLEANDTTCSAVMLRQPWYPNEQPPQAKDTDTIIGPFRVEYNHLVFSPMFTLYKPWVAKEDYGDRTNLNEGMIMRHLEKKGYFVADMKSSGGGNLIEHIGEYSQGKILPDGVTDKRSSRTGEKMSGNLYDFFKNHHHKPIRKWNHYFKVYEKYLSKFVGKKISVLEIGVLDGGSLQMWKHYFGDDADIYGFDINPECIKHQDLLNSIFVHIGSQDNLEDLEGIYGDSKFDIIIDDGGHKWNQQITSFDFFHQRLNKHGVYICEDTHTSYMQSHKDGDLTFIQYCNTLVDEINNMDKKLNDGISNIHFYNSMVVVEKEPFSNNHIPFEEIK